MSVFAKLMQEDIQCKSLVGTNASGGRIYNPIETIKGRLEWQRRKVIDGKGEEAISEAVLYTQSELKTGDIIVVGGKDWSVKSVSQKKALFGGMTDHWEVRI